MRSMVFVFRAARKYTGPPVLTMLSMLALVGVQPVAPWIVRQMVAAVTDPNAPPTALQTVAWLALVALGVYLLRISLSFIRSYVAHVAGWTVVADGRATIYEHRQRLSPRFYGDKQTGRLMSRTGKVKNAPRRSSCAHPRDTAGSS